MENNQTKQAVILAGGLGTRLRPLTNNLPKPMIPINGKPFLEYIIKMLKEEGIKEIIPLLGYLPEKIINYFDDGSKFGVKINYSIGDVSFETGTRIKYAKELLENNFLLIYSDNYWPMKLKEMDKFYNQMGLEAMITAYNNQDGSGEYGFKNNLVISEKDIVLKYNKKGEDQRFNAIDIGFFILNKKILNLMPEGNFSFEKEILPILIKRKQLCAFRTDEPYYYITNEKDLKRTGMYFKNNHRFATK